MNEEQYTKLMNKLDLISSILLMNVIKDMEFQNQVEFLFQSGLTEAEIVKFLRSNRDKVHAIVRKLK